MARVYFHPEHHLVDRIGWLRAAVLGANDGILSTASLIVGVAAAASAKGAVLIAGVAGLVAGAMSMATGEYVSVSSQSDTERADLARERKELSDNIEFEKEELTQIYVKRGLEPSALTFSVGAALPLLMVVVSPINTIVPVVFVASLGFLALLGAIGAKAGGADVLRATGRVIFWGALAMALTTGIGKVFGTIV
jgi:predicted membrane protein (TIGR00267 family)